MTRSRGGQCWEGETRPPQGHRDGVSWQILGPWPLPRRPPSLSSPHQAAALPVRGGAPHSGRALTPLPGFRLGMRPPSHSGQVKRRSRSGRAGGHRGRGMVLGCTGASGPEGRTLRGPRCRRPPRGEGSARSGCVGVGGGPGAPPRSRWFESLCHLRPQPHRPQALPPGLKAVRRARGPARRSQNGSLGRHAESAGRARRPAGPREDGVRMHGALRGP